MRVAAAAITALLIAGCAAAPAHPDYRQLDRRARQEQAREIRPVVRRLCARGYGVADLPELCRSWHFRMGHRP